MKKLTTINVPKLQEGISAQKIDEISDLVISSVVDGVEDALELDIKLKALEEVIKLSRNKIKGLVIDEAEKEKEKYGVAISVRSGYPVYDLDSDPEYSILKKKLKERERLLKDACKSKSLVYISDTGEEIKKPKIKSYTEVSISYTFKKN